MLETSGQKKKKTEPLMQANLLWLIPNVRLHASKALITEDG